MPVLTVIPLSIPGCLSENAKAAIRQANRLFLQTDAHPSAAWIKDEGLSYVSMDDLYEGSADFDALNAAIAARLICQEDAVYAVPGRGPGTAQLAALRLAAKDAQTELRLCAGVGYGQAALAALGESPDTARVCTAMSLSNAMIDTRSTLCVEEVDTPLRAGEIKLRLSDAYPDAYPVSLCVMDAYGAYAAHTLPLYMLDRQPAALYYASTVLIVPPASLTELSRYSMEDLLSVMRRLRAPGGCPWDAEQTHASLRKSLLEETYEVLQTIDDEDTPAMCEELGDLLLQIAFHTIIEEEKAGFTMQDVTSGLVGKLIYRHPHVFGDTAVKNADEVLVNWEKLKKTEKHMGTQSEVMDALPRALPALMYSTKVQKKAADVGFDWKEAAPALDKVYEEADEVKAAMLENNDAHIEEELGDLLFACVNVARLLHKDSELMLRAAADKFVRRFKRVEAAVLADGKRMEELPLETLDAYWDKLKHTR
ncbi:MAG: nucleoside triphosphate pyrophosphohydrolase [Eubacteriales bacterium]|nr:nucleoside triphosphate pyrophosphohydrolase [Eubacteriales bacterium]